ncbi:hypothetical protein [Rhizobium sp. SL86]|uniref:hypothetical protein n=1 Tax=Rhizobium sp. SL86 TaxID=2995148 RepID=UPI0022739FC3|nr:hypothetical protein [Rhizobium sp. SL86]MCY1669305.1 hypothetical protein [Rhizobium sp. SL86]
MIIRWTYDDNFPPLATDARLLELARELLRCHRRGHHLVVLDRTIAAAIQDLDLSNQEKALTNRLSQDYTQTGNLHKQAYAYVSIVNDISVFAHKQDNCFKISIGAAIESRVLDPCAVVVEDVVSDGFMYKQIFEEIARKSPVRKFEYELIHGGGQNSVNVLRDKFERKRIALAIIDSDKSSPDCSVEKKTSSLSHLFETANWNVGDFFITPCREVENFVPFDVLRQLPSGTRNTANDVYLRISAAEDDASIDLVERIEMYADLKSGIQLQCCALNEQAASWIRSRFELAGLHELTDVPGYGDRIIEQIKSSGRLISEFRALIRERRWQQRFFAFFEKIFWYFVSNGALRT